MSKNIELSYSKKAVTCYNIENTEEHKTNPVNFKYLNTTRVILFEQ